MANRYTIGSGVSSDPTIWDGGLTVPGTGDRVLIDTGHTVTLAAGDTEWGDDTNSTISINGFSTTRSVTIRGTLKWPRDASATLTINGGMRSENIGTFDMGTEADPIPTAYTAKLLTNKSAALAVNKYEVRLTGYVKMWGKTRKRITTLTANVAIGATSIQVADTTGWEAGDTIFLPNTDNNNSNRAEYRVIDGSFTPGSLTVPLTVATTYGHLAPAPIVNATSNVQVDVFNPSFRGAWWFYADSGTPVEGWEVGHAQLHNAHESYDSYGFSFRSVDNYGATPTPQPVKKVFGIVTRNTAVSGPSCQINLKQMATLPLFEEIAALGLDTSQTQALNVAYASELRNSFAHCGASQANTNGFRITGGWMAMNAQSGAYGSGGAHGRNCVIDGTIFLGPANALAYYAGSFNAGHGGLTFRNVDINSTFDRTTSPRNLVSAQSVGTDFEVRLENCLINLADVSAGVVGSPENMTPSSKIALSAPNNDVEDEREFYRDGSLVRNTSVANRSVASAKITTTVANRAFSHTIEIPALSGVTYRVIGYVQYDATYYNSGTGFVAPTVTLDGAGSTPDTFTASSGIAGTWEKFDLSTSHSLGYQSKLKLTITTASPNIAGAVYLAGVPMLPFVGKVRHYGFVFDETAITRISDTLTQASEATAAAYTGISISWGSTVSPVTITGNTTFQQLYDYHQSQAVLNVSSALALTGAGAAGNPLLFAKSDITVNSGFVLSGNGAINLDSNTISTEFVGGSSYTFTGGSWKQQTTVPSFDGGTLSIGDVGSYTFSATDSIISMTPTAPGTYNLGSSSLGGTIDLRNNTAHAITVEVSAGVTTTTANNVGGTITVSSPQIYQSATINNLVTGSRVQVWDDTNNVELLNALETAGVVVWTDSLPAAAPRSIRIRIAQVSGVTAYKFFEGVIGTCGTTSGDASVSFRANQLVDSVYNTNASNGSLVTGITFTDAATDLVNINIPGGLVAWKGIYAAFVYWISTEQGIRDDIAYIDAIDPSNYLLTQMKLKNTSNPVVPLTITGGYGRDATSGNIVDIIDTTGGSIFPLVDHVVNNVVTVGGANIITGSIDDVATKVQEGLTTQGYTSIRAAAIDNLDASVASRLATAGYTAPDNATISSISATVGTNLDVTVSSRLASASYSPPDSAVTVAAAVRSELTTELGRIDVATSTRLSTSGYVAPNNTAIANIETVVTTNLPVTPTDLTAVQDDLTAVKAKTDQLSITAGNVAVDVKKINDSTITGTGTTIDPWRPA